MIYALKDRQPFTSYAFAQLFIQAVIRIRYNGPTNLQIDVDYQD